ncbi:MAG: dethiobiotin synthase [Alphaproteobacteria bacterium]
MIKAENYLILGIGTNIGKTFLVENICRNFPNFLAIKPLISGFEDPKNSDSGKILQSLNLEINKKNLDEISPWRFEKAVSPNFVSNIDLVEIINFCRKKIEYCRVNNLSLLIEGVGGVMSPINRKNNFLDIAKILTLPIILVSSNYLGAISHTLCAIKAMECQNLKIAKIIVNEHQEMPVATADFINCLKDFCNYEIEIMQNFIKKP